MEGSSLLCSARRRDGQLCQATAGPDGKCFAHSPALRAKAQEARRQGGLNRSRSARLAKLLPQRLMPVFDTLEVALGQVYRGELLPQRAQAMASLAGCLVKLLTSGELEQRVRQLEERQASANGSRPK